MTAATRLYVRMLALSLLALLPVAMLGLVMGVHEDASGWRGALPAIAGTLAVVAISAAMSVSFNVRAWRKRRGPVDWSPKRVAVQVLAIASLLAPAIVFIFSVVAWIARHGITTQGEHGWPLGLFMAAYWALLVLVVAIAWALLAFLPAQRSARAFLAETGRSQP